MTRREGIVYMHLSPLAVLYFLAFLFTNQQICQACILFPVLHIWKVRFSEFK